MANAANKQYQTLAGKSRSKSPAQNSHAKSFHRLQRTIGNQAVQRMMRSSNSRGAGQ